MLSIQVYLLNFQSKYCMLSSSIQFVLHVPPISFSLPKFSTFVADNVNNKYDTTQRLKLSYVSLNKRPFKTFRLKLMEDNGIHISCYTSCSMKYDTTSTFLEILLQWLRKTALCGSVSPRNGASSVFGWRRRPPDTEGSWQYNEWAVADIRRGVVLQLEVGREDNHVT